MPEGLIADLDMGMNPFLEDELRAADRRVLRAGAAKGKVGDAMLMAPNKPAPLSEWDIGDHSMPQGVVLQEGQLRRRAQGGLVAL